MRRIITIKSNELKKSLEVKQLLSTKLSSAGFEVSYYLHPQAELVISIGGDGSFLKTIHDFDFPEVPVVGINTGHLGFFHDIFPDNIDNFIDSYLKKDYVIQDIELLCSTICSDKSCTNVFAMNEVVVKGDKSRIIHINLDINNKHIQKFSGDGMIISTPTGSTAYNYAAGGSIVDPSISLMQITPLYPINTNAYRSFTSSIICSSDSMINIIPEYRFESSILIVVDGVEYKYDKISSIKTRMSGVNIKLLRMSNYEFWSRVSEKFL